MEQVLMVLDEPFAGQFVCEPEIFAVADSTFREVLQIRRVAGLRLVEHGVWVLLCQRVEHELAREF